MTLSVLSLLAPGFEGSILWRTWIPSGELNKHGIKADWQRIENYVHDIQPLLVSGEYNAVVTPRFIFREPWMLDYFLRTIREHNITWIYDLDDDTLSERIVERQIQYWLQQNKHKDMPPEQRAALLRAGHDYERQCRQQHLAQCDGVTVSTDHLAETVKQYTDAPIYVLPNTVDFGWFTDRLKQRTISPLTIGWSGGWRMDNDLFVLGQAWSHVAKLFPDVHFVVYGFASPSLIAAVPAGRLHLLEWTDLDDYPSMSQNIDIGCCAVEDIDWNLNKSAIKWFEMTMAGSACVASHTLYADYVTHGHDGFLATTVDEWVEHLSVLIQDVDVRRRVQANALATIEHKHNIASAWTDWADAWHSIASYHANTR